jgi:hypothetical protein
LVPSRALRRQAKYPLKANESGAGIQLCETSDKRNSNGNHFWKALISSASDPRGAAKKSRDFSARQTIGVDIAIYSACRKQRSDRWFFMTARGSRVVRKFIRKR